MKDTTRLSTGQPQAVNPDVIPQAMRDAPRWLLHDRKKIPHYADGNARSGKLNSPRDLARLVDFDSARAALEGFEGRFAGLGFALGEGWQGCDLDGVRDAEGVIAAWALEIIERSATYAEISPSGKGVHLIFRGELQPLTLGSNGSGVEFYSGARYFTVTGNALNGQREVIALSAVVIDLMTRKHLTTEQQATRKIQKPVAWTGAANAEWPGFAYELRQNLHWVPCIAKDYKRWIMVCMVIKLESGASEDGFQIFHEWSRGVAGYKDEADCRDYWNGIKNAHDNPVRWGSLKLLMEMHRPAAAPAPDGTLVGWLKAWKPYDPGVVKPVEFYIEGLVERLRTVGLVAPGGTGKTTALLLLGIATALGGTWFDMGVKAGSFVLLSLDDLPEDLEGALEAVMSDLKLKEPEKMTVRARVRLYSLLAFPGVVGGFALEERGAITETKLKDWLAEGLAGVPDLRCIALDTARHFAGGDTNNGRVVSITTKAVTALALTLQCAAILPHHMTKQGARDGDALDQYAGTGSAAFGDNLRVILVLYKATLKELEEAVELNPLMRPTPDAEIIKLVDTRGSLRRKAVAPIWIARQGYRLWRINGRNYSPQERAQAAIERVVEAVRTGATSVEKVRGVLRVGKARAEQLVAEALVAGRIRKAGGATSRLEVVE